MLHKSLKGLNRLPFHMPGHKRNPKFNIAGSELDITEIDGFDNLHDPKGEIAEIETSLAEIYNAEKSFLLVNGSTVGILAAIHAVCKRGDRIIIARNCHKSVFNACLLLGLSITYVEPEYNETNGFYGRLCQKAVDKAIDATPDAAAIVITSPTYEGYISKIKADIPLIIDAAHGAHLGLGGFPPYPEADIVISSLHKTLPALTQTAVINIYNKAYIEKVKLYLEIFETSSPSYVLMNSASVCCEYIKNNEGDFEHYRLAVEEMHKTPLDKLDILNTNDCGKIVVSTARANLSGNELADKFRTEHNIEPEAASINYVILMTSVGDTEESLTALKNALIKIDSECEPNNSDEFFEKPPCPARPFLISISDLKEKTSIDCCAGKKAAEFVYAYPPDIPILVPGELIAEEALNYIKKAINCGVNLISDCNLLPNYILTKKD